MIHFLAIMEMTTSPPTENFKGKYDALLSKHADGTFMDHLKVIRQRGLLSSAAWEICEEVNRGRNHFLHWKPGRFTTPKYYGQDVTTADGLGRCLNDVFEVIGAMVGGEDDEYPWAEHLT